MLHAGEADAQGKAKIEPFLNGLIASFNDAYQPGKQLSIDEMVIGFKGRFKFRQFNASKPKKFHIKSFGLVDSNTGYVVNLLIYFGSTTSYVSTALDDEGIAVKIFDTLLQPLSGTGYHVYCDRWYTTRKLVDHMLSKQINLTATVMANRRGFPLQARSVRLGVGDSAFWIREDSKVILCAFRDKKAKKHVIVVSTESSNEEVEVKKDRMKPVIVDSYNQFMNGCDRADQMIGYYGFHQRKSTKWWKKIFFWLLDICAMNAFVLFKATRERPLTKAYHRQLTFRNFKMALILQLEARAVQMQPETSDLTRKPVGRPAKSPTGKRAPGRHLIEKVNDDRRCKFCSTPQAPKRTNYVCSTCPDRPHLHAN